ncbi:hypothetical protein HMI55_004407 [Coelomomyces lativittatus]|nr:hypothetical protein HMI55_004407 [Coelomomyces lativittatus]
MKHHQPYFIKESINLLEIIKDAIEHFHVEELVVDHLGIMIILKSFTQRRTSMLSGASPPTGLHFVVISDSFSSSPNLVFYSHTVAENVFASLRLNESLLVSNFTFGLEISDYTSQRSDVIEWPSDLHRLLACKKGASSNSSFFILDLYHGILEFRAEYESSSLPDMEPQNVMQVLRNVIYFGRTATHLDLKVSEEDIENMTKELFHSPLFVEGKLPIEKLHKQLEYFDCLQRFIVESQLVHNLSEQLREFILIRHISLDCLLAMYKLGKSPSVDALYPFLLESMLISSKKNPNDPQGLHEINTNTIMLCEVLLKLVKMAELYVIKTPKEGVTHLCDLVEVNLVLLKHQSIMRSELEQDSISR